ncbi:hypothetical protein [Pleionea sediminis]|uniref:hypothetical protein n=1 Tax=Pleionea sediminis TaxID=2569479 RepID=UPI001186584F|nr:hypothetical protein [Pleionea sediminis]
MGIIISYIIGALFILLPKIMGKVIAELLALISTPRFGRPPDDQINARPIFSILIGVVILSITAAIQLNSQN